MKVRRSQLMTIGVAAAATALVGNLISCEKKIKSRIRRRYGISDSQGERALGQLLGPLILDGNLVVPQRNGVEIFPAMLAAIKSAERTIPLETLIDWAGSPARVAANNRRRGWAV